MQPEKPDPILIATIDAGRSYSSADLCEVQFARMACLMKVQHIPSRFDVITSPTLSAPALPLGYV
jgi:aspartyl-tRNA(Asn)/glutamyl-tRNA(Gln) amidotransferase subunit A